MGAIDLVVQIEAPPSVASGLQRIGRGGHQIDAVSEGVIFPKFRGDLVACAAVAKAMHDGAVEATRYPRNPLDVLAQQIVAMASMDEWDVDELFATHPARGAVRGAEPRACSTACSTCCRAAIRPTSSPSCGRASPGTASPARIVAREGAKRVAIANGGTIPDRGLFGVFLLGAGPGAARVGELDEEMVFESRVGETFVLGASSWRIEEITHDRVLVSPAPGRAGQDAVLEGRSRRPAARARARDRPADARPAAAAAGRGDRPAHPRARSRSRAPPRTCSSTCAIRWPPRAPSPTPRTIVVERVRDELGDWRVCVLSPRGGRIHAPWAMAAAAKIREETGIDVETLWGDDGFVVRFPDVDQPPDPRLLLPDPDEVQALVVRQLGATALFAAKFRENAARSLLLPKRRPGHARAAVAAAQAGRRSAGGGVALRIVSGPARDLSRVPARLLRHAGARRDARRRPQPQDPRRHRRFGDSRRRLRRRCSSATSPASSTTATRRWPSAARRRSPSIRRSCASCIGDAELRELLDADVDGRDRAPAAAARSAVSRQKRRRRARHAAVARRSRRDRRSRARDRRREVAGSDRRAGRGAARRCACAIAGEPRYIAVEDAARYRDALGVPLPPGVPEALLAAGARSARRSGAALRAHARAVHRGRPRGALRPRRRGGRSGADAADRARAGCSKASSVPAARGASGPTPACCACCAAARSPSCGRKSSRSIRRCSAGFATTWQGIVKRRRGADALLDVIEQLQGAPLPASILETEILPARLDGYDPARPRRGHGGGRGGLGRRRAARRARRPHRAVSRRSPAAAAAAQVRLKPDATRPPAAGGTKS